MWTQKNAFTLEILKSAVTTKPSDHKVKLAVKPAISDCLCGGDEFIIINHVNNDVSLNTIQSEIRGGSLTMGAGGLKNWVKFVSFILQSPLLKGYRILRSPLRKGREIL